MSTMPEKSRLVVPIARLKVVLLFACLSFLFSTISHLAGLSPIVRIGWTNQVQAQEAPKAACEIAPLARPVRPHPCRSQQVIAHGQSVRRALAKGELVNSDQSAEQQADCYEFDLKTGQFARVVVEQDGTDVALELFGPTAATHHQKTFLSRVDRTNLSHGPEAISWIAGQDGSYMLQVFPQVSITNQPGQYGVKLEPIRNWHTAADRERIQAEKEFTEAEDRRARKKDCEIRESLKLFERASERWKKLGDRYEIAWSLYGVGLAHLAAGSHVQGIAPLTESLQLMRGYDRYGEAAVLSSMAANYLSLGDPLKARDMYTEALSLRLALNDEFGQALTLSGLATAQVDLEQYADALGNFKQSLVLRRKLDYKPGEIITLNGIARLYTKLGDYEPARKHFKDAIELLEAGRGDNQIRANLFSDLGQLYASQHPPDDALAKKTLTNAVELADLAGDQSCLAASLYRLARVEDRLNQFADAWKHVDKSLKLLERLSRSSTQIDRQLKSTYLTVVRDVYAFSLDLLMMQHQRQPFDGYDWTAFEVSERMRARILLDMLTKADVELCQDEYPRLLSQRRELMPLTGYLPTPTPTPHRIDRRVRDRLSTDPPANELSRFYQAIQRDNQVIDKYSVLCNRFAILMDAKPLSLKQIQTTLDQETLALEYAFGAQHSYLWVVSKNELHSFVLSATPSELAEEASRLIEMMTVSGGAMKKFEKRAGILANKLIPAEAVPLVAAHRRLVFIADGMLQSLPLSVLSLTRTEQAYEPLIVKHEVINIPSLKILSLSRSRAVTSATNPAYRLLVIGETTPSLAAPKTPQSKRVDRSSRNTTDANTVRPKPVNKRNIAATNASPQSQLSSPQTVRWTRIDGAQHEANLLKEIYPPARVKLSPQLDTARILPLLGQYRIIHFATHGTVANAYPSRTKVPGKTEDSRRKDRKISQQGFLDLNEVYNLKLSADLVVLSACETCADYNPRGDWLDSLANGFIYAGARRVVASLWPVPQGATTELLKHFYQSLLNNGQSAAEALRIAQVEMWRSRQWSPSDWASFTIYGDW